MQVRNLIELFIEESLQEICIFDLSSGKEVYKGMADEIPSEYEYCDICSIDTITRETQVITLNIDLGE